MVINSKQIKINFLIPNLNHKIIKMSSPLQNQSIPKVERAEIYLQSQKEFKQNRNRFKVFSDPILQQNNKYTKNPKPMAETKSYYSNLEEKEERPRKKVIPQKNELVITDNYSNFPPENPEKKHKKFLTDQYEQRIHLKRPNSKKYISCKAREDTIGNIFTGEAEITKERPHVRRSNNMGKPSEEYIRMVEKRTNLPHHRGIPNSVQKENTFNNIFSSQGENERPHKKKVQQMKGQIGSLLAYDNTPKGYDNVASKPNQIKYDYLVNLIKENKQNRIANK